MRIVQVLIAVSAVVLATACSASERIVVVTSSPTATPAPTTTRATIALPTDAQAPTHTPTPATATMDPCGGAGCGEWDYGGPAVTLPPLPPQPALPNGATRLATGTSPFELPPGDALTLGAVHLSAATPPSAALVWTLAWRATEPLSAAWMRQIARVPLGHGRWGTAELGGADFELRNDGTATVRGEVSYVIGSR